MKKTLLTLLTITVIVIICDSCSLDRRWYSTYKDDKTHEKKTEHYNGYKRRWYKKNWNNRRMWK